MTAAALAAVVLSVIAVPGLVGAESYYPPKPPPVQPPPVQPPPVQPPAVQPPAVQPPAVQPPAVQPPAGESSPVAAPQGATAPTVEASLPRTGGTDPSRIIWIAGLALLAGLLISAASFRRHGGESTGN